MNFKFNFGAEKLKNLEKEEKSTVSRDWKIMISVFALVMISAVWFFWSLAESLSLGNIEEDLNISQSLTINNAQLGTEVDYYKMQEEKFENAKANPVKIADPHI